MKSLRSDLKDPPEVPGDERTATGSGVPSVSLSLNYTVYIDVLTLTIYRRESPPAWTVVGRLLSVL